jgi:hypothetical protein
MARMAVPDEQTDGGRPARVGTPAGDSDGDGALEHPEVVTATPAGEERQSEAVEHPAKVMRIGSMIKLLLEEVRQSDLDEASRDRLREIYETSVRELADALSPDLRDELGRLAHPFAGSAKAQLVGWLEGLFHGIQATLFAQQMAARQQLEEMRRRLPPGAAPTGPDMSEQRPGTYL